MLGQKDATGEESQHWRESLEKIWDCNYRIGMALEGNVF